MDCCSGTKWFIFWWTWTSELGQTAIFTCDKTAGQYKQLQRHQAAQPQKGHCNQVSDSLIQREEEIIFTFSKASGGESMYGTRY